jgi:hypothetical protein
MKRILFTLTLALILSAATFAQARIESIYTSTKTTACKPTPESEDGSYRGICRGVGGYTLELLEGDLRQTINVIDPKKKKHELDLWTSVSSGFSSMGDKVEWRVTRSGKTVIPKALIIRFNASENPEDSSKITSYLVVVAISKTYACVTDLIPPSRDQNVKARQAADSKLVAPCRVNE